MPCRGELGGLSNEEAEVKVCINLTSVNVTSIILDTPFGDKKTVKMPVKHARQALGVSMLISMADEVSE